MGNFYRFAERALDRAERAGELKRKHAIQLAGIGEAGATERTGMTEAGALKRTGMTEAGALKRTGMTERGALKRTGMTEAGQTERQRLSDSGQMVRQRLAQEHAWNMQQLSGGQARGLVEATPIPFTRTEEGALGKTEAPGFYTPGTKEFTYAPPVAGKVPTPALPGEKKKKTWQEFNY